MMFMFTKLNNGVTTEYHLIQDCFLINVHPQDHLDPTRPNEMRTRSLAKGAG